MNGRTSLSTYPSSSEAVPVFFREIQGIEVLNHRQSNWSGNWSERKENERKGPLLLGFMRVKRCLDRVGVCGSNPHAPTRFIGLFVTFVIPSSFTAPFARLPN